MAEREERTRDESSDVPNGEGPENPGKATEPTPQPKELRRQQYIVGVGGAVIAGLALAISSVQHFPELPVLVPILAGLFGGGIVYWIISNSLFPTEEEIVVE